MVLKNFLTQTRLIALSFVLVILTGTLFLMLPISSATGESTPFLDALFTSCSATTTTGLTTVDTGTHYSFFGHVVILLMMQIGGLGILTYIAFFSLFLHGKISLHEQNLMMQAAGVVRRDSVFRLVKRILLVTLIVEGVGTALLTIRFIPKFGFWYGLFFSFFHTVSAFSNSGFDLGGVIGSSSLSAFTGDPLVLLTIAFVGLAGGLGFIVWDDIMKNGLRFRKYSLHSKVALTTTGTLLVVGYVLTLLLEWNVSLASYSVPGKLLCGFFGTVTPLTSGYYAVSPASYSDGELLLSRILMMIGGTSGSTAGGIKVTTVAVLVLSSLSSSHHGKNVEIFKRRFSDETVRMSGITFFYFIVLTVVSALIMATVESTPFTDVITDVTAALSTDGLSTGCTPGYTVLSKIILMILMIVGRIGGIALLLIFGERGRETRVAVERPVEEILVG